MTNFVRIRPTPPHPRIGARSRDFDEQSGVEEGRKAGEIRSFSLFTEISFVVVGAVTHFIPNRKEVTLIWFGLHSL